MNNSHDEIKKLLEASRTMLSNDKLNEDVKKIKKSYGIITEQGSPLGVGNQRTERENIPDSVEKKISFTVNPEIDTVEQMKRYSISHNADDQQWHFLTGKKEALYDLARKSFFVLKPAEAQNLGDAGSDFIHTNNFVLVDQLMRIRGYYDGTNPKEVDKLIKHIQLVLEEKNN
jgi:protein SCO1/2